MKTIWIMNHYMSPLDIDRSHRHNKFAKYLTKKGYNLILFHSNFLHSKNKFYYSNKNSYNEIETEYGKYISIKTREYNGNGIDRIFNMIDFYRGLKKIAPILVDKYGKPDIIYASSVHPLTLVAGIQIAKKLGIPCVSEVRDLWPLSIIEYTNLTNNNIIIKFLYKLERWIYERSDSLIFTMEGGKEYIVDMGWDKDINLSKIYHINNGIDLEQYYFNEENCKIQDDDLDDSSFKVLYSGSIRSANEISRIIKSAEILNKNGYDKIKFLIYGDGIDKERWMSYVNEKKIKNVIFKGFVNSEKIPYILSKGQINILNYKQVSLYKYGTSQNKLFEYFASGKPVLSTIKIKEEYDNIFKYKCGYSTNEFTPEAIADGILKFYNMPKNEYEVYCKNALNAAKEFDFKVLTDKLQQVILKTLKE